MGWACGLGHAEAAGAELRDLDPAGAGQAAAAVGKLVAGQDAVVNALGQVKGGPPDLMEMNARQLVAALQEHGVKRVTLLSGAGIRVAQDHPSLRTALAQQQHPHAPSAHEDQKQPSKHQQQHLPTII